MMQMMQAMGGMQAMAPPEPLVTMRAGKMTVRVSNVIWYLVTIIFSFVDCFLILPSLPGL